jgi:hypothetical protein
MQWVSVEALDEYQFPAANLPIAEAIKALLS